MIAQRRALNALAGLVLLAALGASGSAQAQFLCQSMDGTAQGADATGSTPNTACGPNANASGIFSRNTATGSQADASGDGSVNIATGGQANASGSNSSNIATGDRANASGDFATNIATGPRANASGNGSSNIATGNRANASGNNSSNIAIGDGADAAVANSRSTAVGASAAATGTNASAFGAGAEARGAWSTALGTSSVANGANAIAIGTAASANFSNSAAFGTGATATRANQQAFGTATNTYTMTGITSAASKAAQSGPTQLVTSDAGGNLATTTLADLGLAGTGDITAINRQIAGLNSRIDDLSFRTDKAMSGVAMAFAMAGVPTLLPSERFAVTMNYGTFEGANGVALNAAFRLSDNIQLNGGVGYGPDQNIAGGRVGLRMAW